MSGRHVFWLPATALGLAVLVPLAILLGTAWLFGWRFQPVETASMTPAITAGALAVVQPADPTRIGPGTTIVFADPQAPSRLVAHRVVRIVSAAPLRFETKGDANLAADPVSIPISSVTGTVGWTIPGLGSVVTAIRGIPMVLILVVLPLVILVLTETLDVRRRRRETAALRN